MSVMNNLIFTFFLLFFSPISFAATVNCANIDSEISNYEKELLHKTQLVKNLKHEMESLSPEATSNKMKLTADIFIASAQQEAAQNWLEAKRKEKSTHCKNTSSKQH
jgi:hypothetical protein